MAETLLQQSINIDNLRLAWNEIADNEGIPGVDRVSVKVWRRNWEERLVELALAVRTNTYQPKPLRVRRIPKRHRRGWRELHIPTVTDRVLQRAVLQVLYPIYETRFLDCSFGYRPGLGLKNAVARILVLRENGFRWLLDADIDNFFDNVNHKLLLQCLESDLPDHSLFHLINTWLKIGKTNHQKDLGIPIGSPISPLLANAFLHRLDQALLDFNHPIVRYADDFVVFAETQKEAYSIYSTVEAALSVLGLNYEPDKTRITCFDEGFDFLGVLFEGDTYSYQWKDKIVEVHGENVDWLFSHYGPDYE